MYYHYFVIAARKLEMKIIQNVQTFLFSNKNIIMSKSNKKSQQFRMSINKSQRAKIFLKLYHVQKMLIC